MNEQGRHEDGPVNYTSQHVSTLTPLQIALEELGYVLRSAQQRLDDREHATFVAILTNHAAKENANAIAREWSDAA